jgi:hypothetical protein
MELKRIAYIRSVFSKHHHKAIFAAVALLYIIINFLVVMYIHGSIGAFYHDMYAQYTIPFTIATIIIGLLVGIDVVLVIEKFEELHVKSAGLGITGLIFGSLAAGCPGCFFGLFPILLSVFGITGTLAILPFNGLEFQVAAIILLCASIYFLAKETEVTCRIASKPSVRK